MEYKEALGRAFAKVPSKLKEHSRFEPKRFLSRIEGNKTVISNFSQVCSSLGRKPEHLLKFLQRELATPGEIKNSLLYLGTRIYSQRIDEKLDEYIEKFVMCHECKRPDSEIIKDKGLSFLVCHACGARRPVREL
ncbi:MAG TPA: translation initiation factor IF-2 subunit beta [Candidatus Woesearchaeota archaeon]|nr:translation initiation factor IF-2 subunit beta [Candidatus Woesearchaeota archaeon]